MRSARKAIASAVSTQDVPATFQQAIRSGYTVESESSKLGRQGRSGTVRLRSSSGRRVTFPYVADLAGYRFGKAVSR